MSGLLHRKYEPGFKVTPDLRGCPPVKNLCVCHFEGKEGKLYIVRKVSKCRFRGKIFLRFLQFCKRKAQTTAKMTMCHSIELMGIKSKCIGKINAH